MEAASSVSRDACNQAELLTRRYVHFAQNPQEDLDFIELALANELAVSGVLKFRVRKISPATFFGRGQVLRILEKVGELKPSVIATNASISAVHQRNLEEKLKIPILTRADIIFEIFAKNATTAEGKLQVELARLRYRLPRITGIGKELSEPGADVGTRGGPGEKLTNLTKREIIRRLRALEAKIEKANLGRELRRKKRRRAQLFNVSLIGYTNSGKSSLLNELTSSSAQVDDRYFTTLDPTARALYLGDGMKVVIKDTVGFLNDLPSELYNAFRATLEELQETSLFLHIVDASRENVNFMIASVEEILEKFNLLGIDRVIIFNKIDLTDDPKYLEMLKDMYPGSLFISAKERIGLDAVVEVIKERMMKLKQGQEVASGL